jgi:outer membrane receptor protein involved in Fe transport
MKIKLMCRQTAENGRINCCVRSRNRHLGPLLVLVLGFSASVASAQDTATTTSEIDDALTYEEIVVTARFRRETVQDIGGAVSALDTTMIERAGITDFEDIAARIPGLNLNDRGPNQNDIGIRGVTNGAMSGLSDTGLSGPLVSQFLDDVPMAQSTASQRDFNLFDFDRVEVLRGPQPTFFGEGSVGGTIRYATRDPDISGETISDSIVKMGVSSTDDGGTNYSVSAASSLVLVPEKFAIRAVVNYRDDDGFIDNSATNASDINDYESVSSRLVALYEPNDELTVRLMAFVGADDIGESNAVAGPPTSPGDLVSDSPIDGGSEDDFEIYTVKVNYDFGLVGFSSITGLFERDTSNEFLCPGCRAFGAFLPVSITPKTELVNDDRSFTQEFRVISQMEGSLSFIAGLYYQDTKLNSSNETQAAEFGDFVVLPAGSDILFQQASQIESEQLSAFVELTYETTDNLRLIGGVRYVDEEIVNETILSTLALGGGDFGLEPPFVLGNLTDFVIGAGLSNKGVFSLQKFLPRAAVEYDMSDDFMIYAGVATGARNGNLNPSSSAFFASGGDPAVFTDVRAFSEDEVLSYEIGAKTQWADGALTVNAAGYFSTFDNPQVQVSNPFVMVANGPELEASGVELETLWRVNGNWSAFFNGAYQHTEFQDNQLLSPATLGTGFEFDLAKGNQNANTPEWSYSIGADAAYPVSGGGVLLTGHVSYNYIGSRFSTVTNFPSSEMSSLGILNLRVGLEDDSWSVVAFANNLTNDIEYTSIDGNLGLPIVAPNGKLDFVADTFAVNRPRTIGIEATFRF